MEATNGKLRLMLRSKKVLARIEEFESGGVSSNSLMAWNGQLFASKRRVAVYNYVFDDTQMQALCEARELARKAGLILEVTDLSRQNALKRVLRSGLGMTGGRVRPRLNSSQSSAAAENSDCVRPLSCQP